MSKTNSNQLRTMRARLTTPTFAGDGHRNGDDALTLQKRQLLIYMPPYAALSPHARMVRWSTPTLPQWFESLDSALSGEIFSATIGLLLTERKRVEPPGERLVTLRFFRANTHFKFVAGDPSVRQEIRWRWNSHPARQGHLNAARSPGWVR